MRAGGAGLVYAGNFVGAVATAGLVFVSSQYSFGQGAVGAAALATANAKLGFGFVEGVALGILCNTLVCLAVWLTFSARTTTDRILAIVCPITAFCSGWLRTQRGQYVLLATPSGGLLTTPAGVVSSQSVRQTEGKEAPDDPLPLTEQSAQTLPPTVLGVKKPPREG
jgi:hypothetical protein